MFYFLSYSLAGLVVAFSTDLTYVEVALVVVLGLARPFFLKSWLDRTEQIWSRLAMQRQACIAAAFFVPIVFRVAVLPWNPVPQPWIPDEFSHLLIGDTLAHGRFSNPTHPLWQHFESMHVLFLPTYASTYFPGLGILLALGEHLGLPWIGVLLSSGLMCAALLWMLYGFFPPRWALLGGALAVLRWGAFSYWVNGYLGGTVGAAAGALALGAYARLRGEASASGSVVLGLGFVFLAYTRPLEGFVLAVPIASALLWRYRSLLRPRPCLRFLIPAGAIVAMGLVGLGLYFDAITGSPTVLPYRVNQAIYGWPLTLPWDHPQPATYRHTNMRLYYEWERCIQSEKAFPASLTVYSFYHLFPIWRFFWGPVLTIPLLGIWCWRRDRCIRMLAVTSAAALVTALVIAAYPHYIAPATGGFLGLTVQGFRHLRAWNRKSTRTGTAWSRAIVATCVLMLLIRTFIPSTLFPEFFYSARGTGQGYWRAALVRRLESIPGNHVVFVQYNRPYYLTTEWVYNAADIDRSRIVWAQDMGPEQNAEVLRYYPDRRAWLTRPDDAPDELLSYRADIARVDHVTPVTRTVCREVSPTELRSKVHRPPR